MFRTVFLFELAFWMRSRFLALCLLFTFTLTYLSLTTEFIRIRAPLGARFLNSPIAVQNHYSDLCDLMIVAVAVLAASRDFTCRTTGIIFSTGVSEVPWLLGRFAATAIVATIPALGILAGFLLATCSPWIDHEKFTANSFLPHLYGLILFCAPTTLLYTTCGFVLTLRLKNAHTPILLFASLTYAISLILNLLIDRDYQALAALLDPNGHIGFYQHFWYWTAQ